MGLFEQVAGKLGGALSGTGGEQSALVGGLLEMLGKGGPGGLADLVQAFESKGLGDIVASWVGTGANLPISVAQIQQALGGAGIQQLAEKTGRSAEATSSKLAEILPATVDSLTPEGNLPETGALEQALGLLRGRLG